MNVVDVVARVRWAPVGAGGRVARCTSAWWERTVAAREHRAPQVLVHALLEVVVDGAPRTIDMSPTWGKAVTRRHVITVGPVGSRILRWCPMFRYELRVVLEPDTSSEVLQVSDDFQLSGRVFEDLADVPAYTWGRDEGGAGEMWTSNSVVAWLLERSDVSPIEPPAGHRAPGWNAGALLARSRPQQTTARRPA